MMQLNPLSSRYYPNGCPDCGEQHCQQCLPRVVPLARAPEQRVSRNDHAVADGEPPVGMTLRMRPPTRRHAETVTVRANLGNGVVIVEHHDRRARSALEEIPIDLTEWSTIGDD